MRGMVFISVLMFVVMAGLSYSGMWYFQSKKLADTVELAIANLNKKNITVTYDAIETSGFPTHTNVELVNPRLKGRIDTILNELDTTEHQLPKWIEDTQLNGTIAWGLNLFSNHYHLTISGDWNSHSTVADKTYHVKSQNLGNVGCDLEFFNSAGIFDTLWNMHALGEKNGEELINNFHLLDCNSAGYRMVDGKTNALLTSSGPVRFFINSDKDGLRNTYRKARLYINVTDSIITPAGDKVIAAYTSAFLPDMPALVSSSAYGKSNMDIDLSYLGPIHINNKTQDIPMEIQLNKFSIQNDAYQTGGHLHFINKNDDGNKNTTKLTFDFESLYHQKYNSLLRDIVRESILKLYSPFAKQPADIQPLLRQYSAADLYRIIEPAIPNLYSLGKLKQSLDFTYEGNQEMTDGSIQFTNLNLSAAPYAVTGSGNMTMTAGSPIPAANIVLNCKNCPKLIDDITHYALRADRVMNILSGSEVTDNSAMSLFMSPQNNGLKHFLAALAKPAGANSTTKDYSYTIVSGGSNGITINKKRLDEILVLYSQTMAPSAPAAIPQP